MNPNLLHHILLLYVDDFASSATTHSVGSQISGVGVIAHSCAVKNISAYNISGSGVFTNTGFSNQLTFSTTLQSSGGFSGASSNQPILLSNLNASGYVSTVSVNRLGQSISLSGVGVLSSDPYKDFNLYIPLYGSGSLGCDVNIQYSIGSNLFGSGTLSVDAVNNAGIQTPLSGIVTGSGVVSLSPSVLVSAGSQIYGSGTLGQFSPYLSVRFAKSISGVAVTSGNFVVVKSNNGNIPFFLAVQDVSPVSGNVPLYTQGGSGGYTSMTLGIPLFLQSDNHPGNIPLYLQVDTFGPNDNNIPLYIISDSYNGGSASIPLYIGASGITAGLPLIVEGLRPFDGSIPGDGAYPYSGGMELYLERQQLLNESIPLFLGQNSGSGNSNIPLYVYCTSGVLESGMALVMPYSVININQGLRLYTHGF